MPALLLLLLLLLCLLLSFGGTDVLPSLALLMCQVAGHALVPAVKLVNMLVHEVTHASKVDMPHHTQQVPSGQTCCVQCLDATIRHGDTTRDTTKIISFG
jgi:hypothetical protein